MKILLTNDDGWDAPGLKTLKSVAQQFGDLWVVAPLQPMSGISHQMTFERPLTLQPTGHQAFSLDGTPADCVRIATSQLDVDFDWVLSGINNGGNLGADIFVSGTVAAAREASIRGYRAIALSQHRHRFKEAFDWTITGWMCEKVLSTLLVPDNSLPVGSILNINFPDKFHDPKVSSPQNGSGTSKAAVAVERFTPGAATLADRERVLQNLEIVDCPADRIPIPADFKIDDEGRFWYCGKYNQRQRTAGCDIANCFEGRITRSLLRW